MFDQNVIDKLKYYVYALEDGCGTVFYIGKGIGNRVFAHAAGELREAEKTVGESGAELSEKNKKIRELRESGGRVQAYIVRHGMDENTAFEVEAAFIDFFRLKERKYDLTNIVRGQHTAAFGIACVEEIAAQYGAKPIAAADLAGKKILLVNIRDMYTKCKTDGVHIDPEKLYHAVRFAWKLAIDKAKQTELVLALYHGIVKGVYTPTGWFVAKVKTPHPNEGGRLLTAKDAAIGRVYFEGVEADERTKRLYDNKKLPDGLFNDHAQNPVKYLG
jgi:hypothetical protein